MYNYSQVFFTVLIGSYGIYVSLFYHKVIPALDLEGMGLSRIIHWGRIFVEMRKAENDRIKAENKRQEQLAKSSRRR